jgi:hypothetical protein
MFDLQRFTTKFVPHEHAPTTTTMPPTTKAPSPLPTASPTPPPTEAATEAAVPEDAGGVVGQADASANKVEAGWADHVKLDQSFTVFVKGSGFEPDKDRIVVLDGDAQCGSADARLAAVTGQGEVPGQNFDAWKSLACSGLTSSASKLACGTGKDGEGVKYSDDGFVDTYKFKVCVCDHSKGGNCDTLEKFDLEPATSTLKLNSVV